MATALLLGSLMIGACRDGGSEARELTPAERSSVTRSKAAIQLHCRRLGLYVAGRADPPSADQRAEAKQAVETLIGVARRKPHAAYSTAETVRLVLGDVAEELEAINCAPDLERRLELAHASLPPE